VTTIEQRERDSQLDLYEALARVRDYANAVAEVLDKLVQTKVKVLTKDYDTEKIQWVEKLGAKGPFQYADPKTEGTNLDFKALLADLKEHDGRLRHSDMFYWLFQDAAGIGRKPAK
jgi:hypothetical protein